MGQYSYSLRAARSGDGIPVGERFSAPVQAGPKVHPASSTVGTGSFQRVKRPGRGVDHPPHLTPRIKKEYSCTSTPLLGLHDLFEGEIYLYHYNINALLLLQSEVSVR